MAQAAPDVIINAAAYNAVDLAQSHPQQAYAVNAQGAQYLAEAAQQAGARLIHISTDYVFDGTARMPYDEQAVTNPLNVYGASKRQGELAVLQVQPQAIVIRTSWLYSQYGSNFVKTILRLAQQRDSLQVVNDQTGSPTYAGDLAAAIIQIIGAGTAVPGGIYHYSGAIALSRFDFARKIVELGQELGLVGKVVVSPVATESSPIIAPRPQYSVLSCEKIRACGVELGSGNLKVSVVLCSGR